MIPVLAHGYDQPALWAFERLRARGNAVGLALVEELEPLATTWCHRLGERPATTEIRLAAGGRRLRTGDATAVLNRLLQPPLGATAYAVETDAEYARGELTAFAASWLRALAPRLLNPPTPQGLCGRWRSTLHWRALAAKAGLPALPLHLDSDDPETAPGGPPEPAPGETTVLTVAGELIQADGEPPASHPVRAAVRRFAHAAETPVLGLRFAPGWQLVDATPAPDLSAAGERGIAALEGALTAA